jgi:dTDP-4-dehydrorhamnose 3,5-epimerase
MIWSELPIAGAWQVDLERRGDERGFFARMFCAKTFENRRLNSNWVQINTSFSQTKGTLRGFHFQRPPAAEVKLVRCLKGTIFDVIVDIRRDSATFGKHVSLLLNDDNRSMVYVPAGCAHGFQTLAEGTELLYFHSAAYSPENEGGLDFSDPDLAIEWPLPPSEMSDRDRSFPTLKDLEPIDL